MLSIERSLLKSRLLALAPLVVVSLAGAEPAQQQVKILSPAAAAKVPINQPLTVKIAPFPHATSYTCIFQQITSSGGAQCLYAVDNVKTPECVVPIETMRKCLPGKATLSVAAEDDVPGDQNRREFTIELTKAGSDLPPSGWDSDYAGVRLANQDGSILRCPKADTLYVAGGQFSFEVAYGPANASGGKNNSSGAPTVHVAATVSKAGAVKASTPIAADALAAMKRQPGFTPSTKSISVVGKFIRENTTWQKGPEKEFYGKGRTATFAVGLPGSAAETGCSFSVVAADYAFGPTDPARGGGSGDGPSSGGGTKPSSCSKSPDGASCSVMGDCCSDRCVADPKGGHGKVCGRTSR